MLRENCNCPRCNEPSLFLGKHPKHGELFCCKSCQIIDSNSDEAQLIWHFNSSRLWENEETTNKPSNVKVIMDRCILWR